MLERLAFITSFLLIVIICFAPWVDSQPRIRYEQIEVGTPQIESFATTGDLPVAGKAGRIARVGADDKLYMEDGSTWTAVGPAAAVSVDWDTIGAMPGFVTASLPTPTDGLPRRVTDGRAAGAVLIADGTDWNCLEAKSMRLHIVTCPPYNAKADGVTDDAPAIQAAIDAASAGTLDRNVFLPSGQYFLNSTLTINSIGLTFQSSAHTAGATLLAGHSSGPVLRVQARSVTIRNLNITSTDDRWNGTTSGNWGVQIEGDDISGTSMSSIRAEDITVIRQPSHAFVIIGFLNGFLGSKLRANFNAGHGFVVEDGAITTGRLNPDRPGILTFMNPESQQNGGHGMLLGSADSGGVARSAFRVVVINAEVSSNAWDPAVAVHGDYQLVGFLENCMFIGSAFGDGLWDQTLLANGDARLAKGARGNGALIGGTAVSFDSLRLIQLSQGVKIQPAARSISIRGIVVQGNTVSSTVDIPNDAIGIEVEARGKENQTRVALNDSLDTRINIADFVSTRPQPRNLIINGGMTIAQEKTSFQNTTSGAPRVIDLWKARRGANQTGITTSQQNAATLSSKALRNQRDSGNSALDDMFVWQTMETAATRDAFRSQIIGNQFVVSLRLALSKGADFSGADVTVQVRATALEDDATFSPSSGSTVRRTVTFAAADIATSPDFTYFNVEDINLNLATEKTYGVVIKWTPVGTAGANDWLEIGDVILTTGTQAMPFTVPDPALELVRAQRHYVNSYNHDDIVTTVTTEGAYRVIVGDGTNVLSALTKIEFPVSLRDVPALVRTFSTAGPANKIRNVTQATDIDATISFIGENGAYVTPTNAGDIATGDELAFHYDALAVF